MSKEFSVSGPVTEPRISVVVPARNEARNIPHVLGALPPGLHEVILVDGHSSDDTIEAARPPVGGVPAIAQGDLYSGTFTQMAFAPQMIGSTGGSQPHTNFQPYLCINFIISLFGLFPSPT